MRSAEQARGWRVFWIVNAVALFLALAAYPFAIWAAKNIGGVFTSCTLHDVFHIYCPTCGATRATWSLIHGRVLEALQYHAAIVLLYAAFLVIDIRALCVLLRGGTRPFRLHPVVWWNLGGVFFAYALARNVALLAFHVDWIGDFIR